MGIKRIALAMCLALLLGTVPALAAEGHVPEEAPRGMGQAMQQEASGTYSYDSFTTRALSPKETLRLGIDVSEFNGTIDWKAVKKSGVEFAFLRAGYRTAMYGELKPDEMFKTYVTEASAAGVKLGAYIFSQAITEQEAKEEAEFLMELVQDYQMDLPLVMDYEFYANGRLYTANLTPEAATKICNTFCATVEDNDYDSMVYCNTNMLTNNLIAKDMGRLWLAQYNTQMYYEGAYEYWQCTSSGSVPGISGRVDLDFWFDPSGNPNAPPFTDIEQGRWYYNAVETAYQLGVVSGVTPTAFAPDEEVQRAQLVTMMYRMEGSPQVDGTPSFSDVTQGYYVRAVRWAQLGQIVNGYPDNTFAPEMPMKRQDLAVVLYRMAGSPAITGDLSSFQDEAEVENYARNGVLWAVSQGILQGFSDSTLQPQSTVTRAQACTMLMRFRGIAANL